MNRQQFIETLRKQLSGLPQPDLDEIIYDYEEHIRNGVADGKSEEEIIAHLGDIRQIANQYRMSSAIRAAEARTTPASVGRAVIMTVTLGFFNIVIILGPYLGLLGALAGLFAAAVGIAAAGIGIMVGMLVAPVFPEYINIGVGYPVAFFAAVGLSCFGVLFFIGDCYIAKYFFKGTLSYLKWNLNIIRGTESGKNVQ
jgi:uncharacterized membrane protein